MQQTVTQTVGEGEAVTGGYSDVVVNDSDLSTTCTATASDDDVYFLEGGMEREAHHQRHLPHGPQCETTLHLPLAAPVDPPR